MVRITADLEVWLVSDPLLASHWRDLARHLSLSSSIPRLEATTRRRLRRDSEKVGELLRLWQSSSPHTYTVPRLLSVLDQMGMKSLYEWVELMTKERVEPERLEVFVRRCNTPLSRPLSVLTEGWSDLTCSVSQSSCSPPALDRRDRRTGGVFTTLYRPQARARHSSYITSQPVSSARPQSSVLENFDRALAEYNQLEGKKKRRTNVETEKYFDNLAALLRDL